MKSPGYGATPGEPGFKRWSAFRQASFDGSYLLNFLTFR